MQQEAVILHILVANPKLVKLRAAHVRTATLCEECRPAPGGCLGAQPLVLLNPMPKVRSYLSGKQRS